MDSTLIKPKVLISKWRIKNYLKKEMTGRWEEIGRILRKSVFTMWMEIHTLLFKMRMEIGLGAIIKKAILI